MHNVQSCIVAGHLQPKQKAPIAADNDLVDNFRGHGFFHPAAGSRREIRVDNSANYMLSTVLQYFVASALNICVFNAISVSRVTSNTKEAIKGAARHSWKMR